MSLYVTGLSLHNLCLNKEIIILSSVPGRYDGNVCVYNAQLTLESSYQYKSDSVRDKHSNIVWEVSIMDKVTTQKLKKVRIM